MPRLVQHRVRIALSLAQRGFEQSFVGANAPMHVAGILALAPLLSGLASTVGALIWPFVLHTPFLAYPLLFVWGGLFVGIYTIMMAVVGSRFQGGDLVSVYAVMSVAWGLGAFFGPGSAGIAMDVSRHGLPVFAAIACALFTVLAILRKRGS